MRVKASNSPRGFYTSIAIDYKEYTNQNEDLSKLDFMNGVSSSCITALCDTISIAPLRSDLCWNRRIFTLTGYMQIVSYFYISKLLNVHRNSYYQCGHKIG